MFRVYFILTLIQFLFSGIFITIVIIFGPFFSRTPSIIFFVIVLLVSIFFIRRIAYKLEVDEEYIIVHRIFKLKDFIECKDIVSISAYKAKAKGINYWIQGITIKLKGNEYLHLIGILKTNAKMQSFLKLLASKYDNIKIDIHLHSENSEVIDFAIPKITWYMNIARSFGKIVFSVLFPFWLDIILRFLKNDNTEQFPIIFINNFNVERITPLSIIVYSILFLIGLSGLFLIFRLCFGLTIHSDRLFVHRMFGIRRRIIYSDIKSISRLWFNGLMIRLKNGKKFVLDGIYETHIDVFHLLKYLKKEMPNIDIQIDLSEYEIENK